MATENNTATETIKVRKDQLDRIERAKESEWEPIHSAMDKVDFTKKEVRK